MAADMILKLFGRKLGKHADYDSISSEEFAYYGFESTCRLPSCQELIVNIESGWWQASNDNIVMECGDDILSLIYEIPHTRK